MRVSASAGNEHTSSEKIGFDAVKKKWAEGLEGMPALVTGAPAAISAPLKTKWIKPGRSAAQAT